MSTECEYPVTILGNPTETIDVSEVADFSVSQRQQAKAETSRKKGCRGCVSSVGGLQEKSSHPKSPRGASPRHREEGPTSVPKCYKRGQLGSIDIGIWHPCRRCRPRSF